MIFLDPGSSNRTSLSPLSCLLAAHQLIRGQGYVLNWRGGRTQIFNMDQSSKSLTVQSKTWILLKIIKKRCVLITKRQVTKIGKSQDGETAEDLVVTCAHLFNQRRPALMVKWLLSSNFLPVCSLFGNTFSLFKGILRGICYGETLALNIREHLLKKECFLSGIARISPPPPPHPISGNLYIFFRTSKSTFCAYDKKYQLS